MSKALLIVLCLLFCFTTQQTLKPILLLPTETTQNVAVDYAFKFSTDTNVPHSGTIVLTFPFQYDPRELIRHKGCFFSYGTAPLQQKPCVVTLRTFSVLIGQIASGELTILIKNIKNPIEASMSSNFNMKTLFRDVTVTQNLQFGKLPFTQASIISTSIGQVYNYENNLIEQGSTWVFRFTLTGSYGQNSTIRFVFPEGFTSNKVQCNITGIVDSSMQTRVFPQLNIYDCLNVKASLTGYQNIILSGVVNPKYEMQMQGLQVQIIQPNNLVILQKIDINNEPIIKAKDMNVSMTIPNKFRNNTITYIFEINMDSTLQTGDYMELSFAGNWTFFLSDSKFIQGIESSYTNKARFQSTSNWPTNSKVFIKNFSQISKESQIAFYLSLRTPIQNNFYNLTITAFKANGKIVEWYTRNIEINETTGYIREMKLHPMNQAVKLPVGQTGPLQITLALRNNLPKTNVLTHGKIVVDITPHIPLPDIVKNGVHKCYFYGSILAKNCTYDIDLAVTPTVTHIVAFTPVDFNFQSSQIPFMVTTQGFQTEDDQGLTIDTLVKRYHFHIQFYTDYSPSIPTEVIFTEWVADAIPLNSLACSEVAIQGQEWSHLKCTFTTPNQVLNNDGHIHIMRFEFTNNGWYPSLGYTAQTLYPDYPCLVYGANIVSTPYPKCDLYTYTSNQAYKSDAGVSYINVYGIETIPANSAITFEFPKIKRNNWYYTTSLNFSILEDTYGYETHYIGLYSQKINVQDSTYVWPLLAYTATSVTVTLSNSVVNKVGDITLTGVDLGVAACDYVIFQVDQTAFPDIGRAQMFTCGSHKCSKFNKPIQYFILYPQSALTQTSTLVFPSILNPSKAGVYTFYLRSYKGYYMQKKISFTVTITADTMVAPVYTFASYDPISQIYPNTKHFYKVSWTLKNKLVEQTSYIEVTFDNYFTLSSTYCDLTTTALSWDGKGIECEVWQTDNKVYIQNMKEAVVGDTFTLIVQITTTSNAASINPTVSVITYVNGGSKVDQYLNAPFTPATVTNTNLQTMTTFDFSKSYEFLKPIRKGYFGDLIAYYDSGLSQSGVNTATSLVLTFTAEFYPYSNVLNLPLSCKINGIRYACSYTLSPFEVTFTGLGSGSFNAGNDSVINITTTYLERNGIYFPANQGRYLFKALLKNSVGTVIETSQQFVDVKPSKIQYFNVTYAHRDANQDNIYIAEFQNGPNTISAYNDATNASRIYIGFPQVNADGSGTVFTSNLGFANGSIVPCYFQTGSDYVTPIAGKKLECRLRRSASASVPVTVEIINFDSIAASKKLKVWMGKIKNPTTKIIDMNFNLKINYYNPTTYQQHSQYENDYNLFIDMLDASISTSTNADKTSQMFEPGAKVGDANKYINHIPYTGTYLENDWFIVVMNSQFQLNGVVNNCIANFYKRCIVFKEINWVAININNGTLIPFYPQITQMPLSISRVDTVYTCYTWKSERWTETITYTISASDRWMELRGAITNLDFKVLGSQNKLNIGQKNVDVMVSFTVSHKVPARGTIEVKFPADSTKVPSIKPHCRSAVSMGSQLYGQNTGKPATNKQGEVGCLVQNSYSWLITSYEELPANSQVMIAGVIDFPTVLTTTLGTGYIVTYQNQHATNVFTNGRIIDYLSTNFPLQVQNKTWNLIEEVSLIKSEPLRINHIGKFEFKLQIQDYIRQLDTFYTGYVDINFWRTTVLGDSGGFSMPSGSSVCSIIHQTTKEKFACLVESVTQATYYITYRLKFYYVVSADTPYLVTISTQKGDSNEGISWPSVVGSYKIETEILYYTNYSTPVSPHVSKANFIEVYGPKFNALNLVSSVSIPAESNLLLFEIVPSSNITNNYHRIVIEIPTISNDNVNLFDEDLGMGYRNYDDLVFDLYDSSISSMKCKFYAGDRVNSQPIKIVCNQFSANNITTSNVVRFGFWVKNPSTTQALAIPIQVYVQETNNYRKLQWQMIEAGIRVIPTSVSPINDYGNFQSDTPYRQVKDTSFKFTNRNTKPLQSGDYYIMKFGFDLRKSDKQTSAFMYPYSSYSNTGDAIFLRNCQTIVLKVGSAALSNFVAADVAQSNKLNVKLNNVIYNPATKLTNTESTITAYAVYMATEQCEKIIHKDAFPTLTPYEPTTPDFTMTAINSNLKFGQYEDYKFTFRMNNDILTDASYVKKISIQFPADTTYDFKFRGQSCIEDPSTTIQIKKCVIDTSTYTIWIDPVVKSTYINNHYIIFQTIGLAIINPLSKLGASNRVYLNNFVIKYYTWANDDNPPAIFATSDDYCFMRQDSTRLSGSSYLTYTSTTGSHHDYADFSEQIYTNEFLPLSTDLGTATTKVKVPLEFKFIAPTAFANKEGTGSYHTIKINYGNSYSVTSTTKTNDLYRYIPSCELNGYRILSCSVDTTNKEMTMSFQQAIAASEQVSVKFSILDPVDSTSDGFVTLNTASPVLTIPVYVTPSGGTSYYFEPYPFPTYYKSSGITYPSMGISRATVSIGTQVYGKMNYLDFVIQFSRGDVNGLILEIPLVELDGSIVYSNSKLLSLQSGAEYPCSVGHGMNVFCYYERGETKTYGKPTRIYITRWAMPATNTLSFRMLFTNPDIINVFPSFIFKAYGGTIDNSKVMGDQYMGEYRISNAFKTLPATPTYFGAPTCAFYPTRRMYSIGTNVEFHINNDIGAGGYVMLEWPLHDSTYGQVSLYQVFNNTYDYDYFVMNYARNNRKLYIVKKITATWSGSGSSHHDFGYLRNKHFLVNTATIYYFQTPYLNQYSCTYDASWHNTNRDTNQFAITMQYLDLQDRISGGWGWQFLSIDLGSTNPTEFNSYLSPTTDLGEMIFVIKWTANLPYQALSNTVNDCSLEDGLRNTNLLKPITCTVDSANNEIVFKNVNKLSGRYLKFYYYAQTTTGNVYYHRVQLKVYANSDAYTARQWEIFTDQTDNYVMNGMQYVNDGSYSSVNATGAETYWAGTEYVFNHDYDTGSIKITGLSSSSISFDVTKGTAFYQNDVYRVRFRFYVTRLTFSGGCSVSTSGVPRSGGSCTASGNQIFLEYEFWDSSLNNNHDWANWAAGATYSFTFSVSVAGQLMADYLFASVGFSWYKASWYNWQSFCGGCLCNQCPESASVTGSASNYCCGYMCWSTCYYSDRYCRYYNCRRYQAYGGVLISGKPATKSYYASLPFVASYTGDLVSYQKNVETELMIHFTNFNRAVGPGQETFIMFQFNGQSFTDNNPFPYTSDTEYAAQIQCKCLVGTTGTISVTSTTSYQTPKCVRYLPSLLDSSIDPSVAISIDVGVGQDLRCYFPGYLTTSSATHNIDVFLQEHNYIHTDIPRAYWAKYSQYNDIDVNMNTYSVAYGITFDDYAHNQYENNFWEGGETTSSHYYELNFSMQYNEAYPEIYMSMLAPVPVSEFCTTTSWSECRVYDTFTNRRFFFVAKSVSSSISNFRIAGTSSYPPAIDQDTAFHDTLLYVTQPAHSRYLFGYSNPRTSSPNLASIMSQSTNTKAIQPSMFGSFLETYNSSIIVSAYLPGRKVYSNSRTSGPFRGSHIKVTFTGFTNLKGCSATLKARPISLDSPFYCQVISISEINIFSRSDLTITDYIYFTVYTAGLPSTSTFKVELFDKYVSASDYSRSHWVSNTFCQSKGSYSTIDPTQVSWRRPAYKEYMTGSGPVRFKFRNNLQYVSDYSETTFAETTNTNAIVVSMPSGFSASDNYVCFAKEYEPGKESLYRRFQVPCGYWSYNGGNKVHIKPLPAYILKPAYFYEFVIYRHANTSTMLITLPAADVYSMEIITSSVTSGQTVTYYDYFDFYKYKNVYPCVLNSIYTLTKEAAANNSLYIDFTLSINGTNFNYFEFEIPNLGLSSFKIDNGEEIPCYLSNEFATVNLKTQPARCFGYTNGIDTDSPLIIRVFGIAAWASFTGTNFKLAFDNFNNPAVQKLFLVPIDITFRYIDRQNRRKYQSFWPSVYLSDSFNMGSPTEISGSLSRSDSYRGNNNYHYVGIGWPYNSNVGSLDTSQKVVLKLAGGVTCCQSFANINLRDNDTSYNLLWRDTKANISVYLTPNVSAGVGKYLWIHNVNNPYPYQRDTYQKLKKIEILFYNNWKAVYSKKLDQFDYSAYSRYDQFTVDTSPTSIDTTKSYYFHEEYPMTHRFAFTTSRNNFDDRQLSYTIVTFTAGVTGIEWAHNTWSYTPYYFNSLSQITIGKNANNKYFLNISGMSDSTYATSQKWYFVMRYFSNSDTISYTSETYCINGELEFTNSRTITISSSIYQTAPYAPTAFELREKKYFKNYYELQRVPIYAKASASTSKLEFRFKTPYSIINQETIDFVLPDTTELYPINTPTTIYCLIRKTITTNLETGISRWSDCTYSSGKYRVVNPIGDLTANTEYTLTILERNQTTSAFKLPYTPKRVEVSQIYTSQLNLLYGDVYELDFSGRMNSISWTHASIGTGQRNMIGVLFSPQFTLNTASLTTPVTQTMIELQIYAKEFDSCIGAKSLFTTDGAYFASGTYYSHYSSTAAANVNANTRVKCGQHSESFAPIKLTTTDYGTITAGNTYYFRYPLILNPNDDYIPYIYSFKLIQYQTDSHVPVLIASYEYEGLESTRSGTVYSEYGYVTPSNGYVQSTMTLTFSWPNFNQGSGSETWLKFKNNEIQALTDIVSLKSITTGNYDYEYYPNINLCVYIKANSVDDRTVNLGSFPTNDDIRAFKLSWAHLVYTNKIYRREETTLSYATARRTAWDTSSFTLVSGLKSTGSEGIFRVTWMTSIHKYVEGSYIKVTFQNSPFNIVDEFCKTMSGFVQGSLSNYAQGSATVTSSNLMCRRTSPTTLLIEGYQTVNAGTTLSFDIYLKVASNTVTTYNSANVYIQVWSKDDKAIIEATTNSLSSYSLAQGAQNLKLEDAMRYKFLKDTARELFVQFKLAANTLGINQYVDIDFGDWQLDTSATGKIVASYQVGSSYYYIPCVLTKVSGNKYRFGVYKNVSTYSMTSNSLITLKIDHVNPDNFYGILVPNIKWNYIKITAHNAAGTVIEHQYAEIWIQPYEHLSLDVQPALDYVDATSIYEFTVTPNVSATAGDYIFIEFTTGDGLYSDLFDITLGKTIPTNDSLQISCRQTSNAMIISNTNIKCELFKGDISASPPIPATIQIKVEKNIAANQLISFNILSLKNPARQSYPIGVTFKLAQICYQSDQNKLCSYYKSTKYMYFKTAAIVPTTVNYFGSLVFDPLIVSATNSKHIHSAPMGIAVGDFIKIVYYPEVIVKETCSLQGSVGVCYAYPLENTVVIKATAAQAGSFSYTLLDMTNLYQYQGNTLTTEVWQASTKTITKVFTTTYQVQVITTDPISTNPLSITFTPTLTPNYQLSYNFDNIAKVKISYLLQNSKIQQILLSAPGGITLNSKYCNATLESTAAEAKPYPYRFKCQVISSSQVRITQNSDFPAWNAGFIDKKVVVYLMYTISQGLLNTTTSNWVATTYTDPTSTSTSLRVSQAVGNFFVQLYQSPYIYKIDFFTYSFTKRICQTGEKCMFYGYLLPTTPQASFQIKYMDYTIPTEFMYSSLLSYDSCDMKEKNGDNNPFGCTVNRNNSKVTIRFMPDVSYIYNHNYKLIKIDNKDATKLFTAPQYPGTHYQMKVDLYTNTSKLIESQYINLTTVYGKLLSWNDIAITIPQDASTYGVFQFTFKVGASDIEPAYESSSTNKITSAIEVIFSSSFEFDLGTGKKSGEEVACLPILNLNLKTMGKLTCKIYPSYSTITSPTIIVTGYDKILSGQVVTFMVAGLKSLPISLTDYIKIGVSYKYYDYGNVKGYLYEPTGKVVGPVIAKSAEKSIAVTVTQTSSNMVGQLVNYYFTCTFTAGFTPVSTSDYVGIEFPQYGFEGRFSLNPKAKCSPAVSQACYSFGLANVIYFKPAAEISALSLSFSLRDTINTAFAFDYKNMSVKIFTVISGKIDSVGTGYIVKLSKPSLNISGLVTKSDSIYGGQSGISYYVDFKLGSYLPEYGKISITFPNVYSSLFDLYASCNFTSDTLKKLSDLSYCEVVSTTQLIIIPNGILLDKDTTYSLIIYNLTNPNANITKNLFTIQSFYSSDIYNKQIISQNTFSPPEINVLTVKNCQFDLTIETKNQNYKSFYSMALICPSVIKEASRLQVYLPWNLTNSDKQLCSSDSSSLYSYECSIKNEYINNKLTSFMEIYLRQHVPQKLISLKGSITNGVKGSYSLNASVSYKGFTYLVGTSNKIYIEDATVKQLTKMEILIQNYPYNRNYESLYIFKLTNPKISANSLRIEVPSVITQGPNGISCDSELSSTSKDYFMFLTLKNVTMLSCSMDGQSILINGLSAIITALKDDQFLFLDVFGLKNPDISVDRSEFKFTFLNITDSTGTVIGTMTQNLPYKVSQAPLNMQMNSIDLSSQKLQVINNYTFITSTIASTLINITAQSEIGVKILFPQEYSNIWSITPQPSQIKIYLGATVYTSTNINMVNRLLMARFTVGTFSSFSQVKVVFEFRNPSTQINCTASNFLISLFDFKQNSIVAETVGNNAACLSFSDKLFWIKISGNSEIRSGNFSVYTIELEKPAKYLKITPRTTTSAITFSPSFVIFENYTSTIQQFKIVSSPGFVGSFLITFDKEEQLGDLFYNDINNETVTLVAPTVPFMINFEQISVKSVGESIESFISVQVPSTVTFALLHTNNCSSSYDITPVGRITIPAGKTQVSFSIKYKGDVIPYMCSIKFEISSLTNINYALATSVLYLSGEPSIDRTNSLRPMILRITKQPKDSRDVGTSILTSDTKSTLKPTIYELRDKNIKANWIQLQISTSEPGFVYYVAMEIGTQQDKVTQKMIYEQSIKTGLVYNKTRAVISSVGSVNILTDLFLTGLQSDKRYLIGAYVNSTVGLSDIKFKEVQTIKSSNGAVIKICFNSIENNETVLGILSTILRLKTDRLSVFTFRQVLEGVSSTYSNQVMNSRRYVYEIVLAPNRYDDSISPMQSFKDFITTKSLQYKVKVAIPSFDLTYTMTAHELILAKPRIRGNGITVEQLTYQNVRVSVRFWESAYVYGVIVQADSSKPGLLTKQIIDGLNRENAKLNTTHRVSTQTDDEGVAVMEFRLLSEKTDYEIFVTAECVLPYNPRAQFSDSEVLKQSIKTTTNLNVINNGQKIIEQLKQIKNNELAQAVKEHLLSVQQKKVLNEKVTRIRKRK